MLEQMAHSRFLPENAGPIVLLVDQDQAWLTRLDSRLKKLLPATIQVRIFSDPDGFPASALRLAAGRRCLLLSDSLFAKRFDAEARATDHCSCVPWESPIASEDSATLRHLPVSRIAAWIVGQLGAGLDPGQTTLPERVVTGQDCAGLVLAIDHGWPGHHQWLIRRMAEARQRGQEVVYLGLKPSHQLMLIHAPGSGPNLTAALLRLEQGDPLPPESIGHYIEPHPAGYWQFRPPERSDDILLASLPAVRALVSLTRQRFTGARQPGGANIEPALVVVDVSGFTWQSLGVLAVLSDHLAVRLDLSDTYAAKSSQRELSLLLARLPASCKIIEMRLDDDSRLCDPATPDQPSDPASGLPVLTG